MTFTMSLMILFQSHMQVKEFLLVCSHYSILLLIVDSLISAKVTGIDFFWMIFVVSFALNDTRSSFLGNPTLKRSNYRSMLHVGRAFILLHIPNKNIKKTMIHLSNI